MKDTIMKNLSAVVTALNSIAVSGKQNLNNLAGSIGVLEDTMQMVSGCEITPPDMPAEPGE